MAEIDKVIVINIDRDGVNVGGGTVSEQEINNLRTDLASPDHARGAALIGYQSSANYPAQTAGRAIYALEQESSNTASKADTALNTANLANAKATDAQERAVNALLKGNDLSDVDNAVQALANIGGMAADKASITPQAGKIPQAGSDGTIQVEWVKDLKYNLAYLRRSIDLMKYPDGNIPYIDWDFTTETLPPEVSVVRGSTATYIDRLGKLVVAGVNEPVFEYTSQGLLAGLRKERRSTNILNHYRYNQDYWIVENGIPASDARVIENYGEGLDGEIRTAFLTTNSTTETGGQILRADSVNYKAGQKYTFSVMIKIDVENTILPPVFQMILPAVAFGDDKWITVDLTSGEWEPSNPANKPDSFGYKQVAGSFFRFSITATTKSDFEGVAAGPRLFITDVIDQNKGIEFDMLQMEEGDSPTSIIPTDGSPATRAVETIRVDGPVFQNPRGTILSETLDSSGSVGAGLQHGYNVVVGERDNTSNFIGLALRETAPGKNPETKVIAKASGGVDYGVTVTHSANVVERVGVSMFPGNALIVSVNGSDAVGGTVPIPNEIYTANSISFGALPSGNSSSSWSGYIRLFRVYDIPFADANLKTLTGG